MRWPTRCARLTGVIRHRSKRPPSLCVTRQGLASAAALNPADPAEVVRIMVRLARRGAARSLHVSVEHGIDGHPDRPPSGGTGFAPVPRLVDPSVLAAVTSASRSGITAWGEVFADFTEPGGQTAPAEATEAPQPGSVQPPAAAAARIVGSLYDELRIRVRGWHVPELDGSDPDKAQASLLALVTLDRAIRDAVAEHRGTLGFATSSSPMGGRKSSTTKTKSGSGWRLIWVSPRQTATRTSGTRRF